VVLRQIAGRGPVIRSTSPGRLVGWVTAVVAAVIAGILIAHVDVDGYGVRQAVVVMGCLGFAAVGVAMLRGLTLVEIYCAVLVWVSPFTGFLSEVNVGPISANGAWTLIVIAAGGVLWVMSSRQRASGLSPLLFFAIQGAVSLAFVPLSVPAIQSVLAVFALIVSIAIVAASGQHIRSLVGRISKTLGHVSWIAIGMYVATVAVWGLGNNNIVGPRGFALLALIPLTWNYARWRYGDRSAGVRALGLLGTIVLGLSRLAIVVGLLLWPLSRMSSRASVKGWARILALVIASSALFFAAFQAFTPLRDRFLEGDVKPVGGVSINVSGRDDVWAVIWQSAMTSPWVGQGAGSAESELLGHAFKVSHPHNEYLRIFHDFGLVGVLLWFWGFFVLLRRTFLAWRRADRVGDGDAYVHLAAWLALVSLALGMITDNSLRYVHVLLPLGVIVGCSLGLMGDRSRDGDRGDARTRAGSVSGRRSRILPSSAGLIPREMRGRWGGSPVPR
jgi:O-antigen ligase